MTLTPNSSPGQQPNKWMIINTVVLITINLYLAFVIGMAEAKFGGDLIGLIVFACGRALVVPIAFVGIYSISKKYRNNAARAKIMMWGSVIILISNIGGMAKLGM